MKDTANTGLRGLRGRRILIAEDDLFPTFELDEFLFEVGAVIAGPYRTVSSAMAHAGYADAAVLDVNVGGETVFPLIDLFERAGIPFVLFSARGDDGLPSRLKVISKLDQVMVAPGSGTTGNGVGSVLARDLPAIRVTARLLHQDPLLSDQLLERSLRQLTETYDDRPRDLSPRNWLVRIMVQLAAEG